MEGIIKRLLEGTKSPDEMYEDYLSTHIDRANKVFEDILKPVLMDEGITDDTLAHIRDLIENHDASKYSDEEWAPYRDHFYDPEKNPKSGDAYDKAWNHHQKSNPHHWQYWVLINDVDEPQLQALEMPFEYVIELLADWQSAGAHYGNTAYDWYQKQKDKMILHPNTRQLIEKYIEYLK